MNQAMQDAINEQINIELTSAYVYLAMSAYFDDQNLGGIAGWLKKQANEELGHAMRLFGYLVDRGGRVVMHAIPQPDKDYGTALEAFRKVLKHEQHVTASINRLYAIAVEQNDYPTQVHLHWFIDEQVEEEKTASDIVGRLELVGDHKPSLLMLDHQLGRRSDDHD